MSAVHSFEVPVTAPVRRRHLMAVPSVVPAPRRSARVFARRRFAALLVLLIVVGGAFMAGRAVAAGPEGAPTSSTAVTVKAGETLSGIAHREMPQEEIDRAVFEIAQYNHLASMQVSAGQTLLIPQG